MWARSIGAILIVALMLPVAAVSQLSTYANPLAVPLGTAGTYGALAYSGITGSANVNGDVGTTTASIDVSIIPSGTNWEVGGQHNADAQTDLTAALTNANDPVARPTDFTIPANLDGLTLYKGIYDGGALDLANTGTLTISGTATDVFIIRASSTLIINTGSSVNLTGGAVWSNVFWYVGTSATIYGGTAFNGIILASSSITVNASAASVTAKLLASTGAVTINSDILPVELTSFTASLSRMNAELHWSTATEVNNHGFEVERRSTETWNTIGFVGGAGTSNSPKEYSFTDKNLTSGTYSYRLKQIDRDGMFSYSHAVEVIAGRTDNSFSLTQNYPNPFNPSTTIEYNIETPSHVSLKIYNLIGDEMATLVNSRQDAGSYVVSFNTSKGMYKFPSGVYFYRLQAGTSISTKRLILMK
jgi:hypothetical protein